MAGPPNQQQGPRISGRAPKISIRAPESVTSPPNQQQGPLNQWQGPPNQQQGPLKSARRAYPVSIEKMLRTPRTLVSGVGRLCSQTRARLAPFHRARCSQSPLAGRNGVTTSWCPSAFQGGHTFSTVGLWVLQGGLQHLPGCCFSRASWPCSLGLRKGDQLQNGPASGRTMLPVGTLWPWMEHCPFCTTPHTRGEPARWGWALV